MRPFVFINVAITADGKMDTIERHGAGISSAVDKERVMELRAGADAVMVGGHTLITEDPKLTVKSEKLRKQRAMMNLPENPMKVGITTHLLPNPDGAFMTAGSARRVIFTTNRANQDNINSLSDHGAEVFIHGEKRVNLVKALDTLSDLGMKRLMVEGGGTLNFELLRLELVDEVYIYMAPMIFGGFSAPTMADGTGFTYPFRKELRLMDIQQIDPSGGLLVHYSCSKN